MAASLETKNTSTEVVDTATISIFLPGQLSVEVITLDHDTDPAPPIPILIASPKDAGIYPVVMFLHGFLLQNYVYKQVLKHIASFGFIMIAPQFQANIFVTDDTKDITAAAKVTDWLTKGLPSVLPNGVKSNFSKLVLAGHSRGGHTAFSLALGYGKTNLKFSALIGLDPVAGSGKSSQISPEILTYEPSSFNIAMPILVIGTGLGEEEKNIPFPHLSIPNIPFPCLPIPCWI
ncbi:unnamed protein product [Urochloa humidicola]